MRTSQSVNNNIDVHPLKGLLMGKGAGSAQLKIRNVLRKMQLVQQAMEDLVDKQKASREAVGSECIELYLATNLRSDDTELYESVRHLPAAKLTYEHTKRPMALEWRARRSFAVAQGYTNTARIHAFNVEHDHYLAVYEFVNRETPDFYPVLAGYDILRVTLNNALKSLRKTAMDLSGVVADTHYPDNVQRMAGKISERIFNTLPAHQELAITLSQLYGELE
jgi:hypothetical protein